ncbi:low molecular weight phosphotyrosine protein phosphatase [Sporolactobacillus shoreae]|uniref:protein-tyrosine-phosphatase n=1 Tax=Sporolactobacillus shoreae TaxID=1465501 RepID=A0A4Z0GL15_9BACL|nr:low molecular weight protein-tyrosine-phosphatase [Sporolactobacillus shoreae]TGA96453.1 low molecular weight phosphotyrosine protein phosphatase [Sporolactobacillus shoreae]
MIRVLFVCLGNICRSPMAEAVLRDKVRKAGAGDRIQVDSAGTGDWHTGDLPHFGTRKILKEAGISFNGIHARTVVPEDLVQFDRIIAMDRNNERDLLQLAGNNQQFRYKISRFMQLLNDSGGSDVPDPYYTGRFDTVYQLIDKGTDELLRILVHR